MKNEKILEFIAELEKELDAADRDTFKACFDMIKAGKISPETLKKCYMPDAGRVLAVFAGAVYNEMISDDAKNSGRGAVKKALEKVCKNSSGTGRAIFSKSATINGRQIVCDGFKLFSLVSPVELSPEYMNAGDAASAELEKIYTRFVSAARDNAKKPLTVPAAAVLKAFITSEKARLKAAGDKLHKPSYDFGDGLPAVNAEMLLDVLTVYGPNVQLYGGAWCEAIYITSDAGDGLIMPCKKTA